MNGEIANIMNDNKPLLSDLTSEHVYHCAKCGLCLDACPVYREMLLESHSPRGKVQLAKHIVEEDIEITKHMNDILFSSCLLCGSCVEACPSGVRQDALFSSLRWRAAERYGLGFTKKLFFQVIANGWLMSTSAWFGKWVRKIFGGPWIESKMKVGNLPLSHWPEHLNYGCNVFIALVSLVYCHFILCRNLTSGIYVGYSSLNFLYIFGSVLYPHDICRGIPL